MFCETESEHAGLEAISYTCIREVLGWNPGLPILTETCHGFRQSVQANSWIVCRL
jgi:hypothetical protein